MPSTLHTSIRRLSKLPGSHIGRGPKHPTHPEPRAQKQLDRLLKKYPFLTRFPQYLRFLECYAGATLTYPPTPSPPVDEQTDKIWAQIFGLGGFEFTDEGPLLDDDGFYAFAQSNLLFHTPPTARGKRPRRETDSLSITFLFDATRKRRPALWAAVQVLSWRYIDADNPPPPPIRAYQGSFNEWLDRWIKAKGWLIPFRPKEWTPPPAGWKRP